MGGGGVQGTMGERTRKQTEDTGSQKHTPSHRHATDPLHRTKEHRLQTINQKQHRTYLYIYTCHPSCIARHEKHAGYKTCPFRHLLWSITEVNTSIDIGQ